jgi:hypothetical protein
MCEIWRVEIRALFPYQQGCCNPLPTGETPMKIDVSVPEIVSMFKEIQAQPEQLFDLIRNDIRQCVGHYLSEMMELAFISWKMELSWRLSPIGKVRKNLPRLQAKNFTQTT